MSQGTVKCEHWARNQCLAGSVCLACWSFLGKTGGRMGGDGERWHRAWTDMQINKTMCRQTASLSMGCHLWHRGTLTNRLCLPAHISHKERTNSRGSSLSFFFFSVRMSRKYFMFFKKKALPLLQLALMEAITDMDVWVGVQVNLFTSQVQVEHTAKVAYQHLNCLCPCDIVPVHLMLTWINHLNVWD